MTFFSGDRSGLIGVGHFFDIFLKAPKPSDIFLTFLGHFFDIFSALKCQKNVWLVASALRPAINSLAKCPGDVWPSSGPGGKCPGDVRRRAVQVAVSAYCLCLPSVVLVMPLALIPSLVLLQLLCPSAFLVLVRPLVRCHI